MKEKGLLFVGSGVSGGEEGARYGPSLMPGGHREAWSVFTNSVVLHDLAYFQLHAGCWTGDKDMLKEILLLLTKLDIFGTPFQCVS